MASTEGFRPPQNENGKKKSQSLKGGGLGGGNGLGIVIPEVGPGPKQAPPPPKQGRQERKKEIVATPPAAKKVEQPTEQPRVRSVYEIAATIKTIKETIIQTKRSDDKYTGTRLKALNAGLAAEEKALKAAREREKPKVERKPVPKRERGGGKVENVDSWLPIEPEEDMKALTNQIGRINAALTRTTHSETITMIGSDKRLSGEQKKKYWKWLKEKADELQAEKDKRKKAAVTPAPAPTTAPERKGVNIVEPGISLEDQISRDLDDADIRIAVGGSTGRSSQQAPAATTEAASPARPEDANILEGDPNDRTQEGLEVVFSDEEIADIEAGTAWLGDWSKHERPNGYVETTGRLEDLGQSESFRIEHALGIADTKTMFEIIDKAQKIGHLNKAEVETLLDYNRRIIAALDSIDNNRTEDGKAVVDDGADELADTHEMPAIDDSETPPPTGPIRPPRRDELSGRVKKSPAEGGYPRDPDRKTTDISESERVKLASNPDELEAAIRFVVDINGQTGRRVIKQMNDIQDIYNASPHSGAERMAEIEDLIKDLPEELGIQEKFRELLERSIQEENINGQTAYGVKLEEEVPEPGQEEVSNFDVLKAMEENTKFADFLTMEGVKDDKALENPAYAEKLFQAFEVKEGVVNGLDNIVKDDFEKTLGISVKDKETRAKILESINKKAIENPEILISANKELTEFKGLEERRLAAEARLNGATNGEFAKHLEELRTKQGKLSTVEKFGRFWSFRSPFLNDVMFKMGMRNWGPFSLVERGGVMKELRATKKEMGIKGWGRLRPRFGSVSKHVRSDFEKITKEVESLTTIEGIQKELANTKGRYDQLRQSIMEGVGIAAAVREIAIGKMKVQLEAIVNPNTNAARTSMQNYEDGQKLLDSLASSPSALLLNIDRKKLQQDIDKAIEKIVIISLGTHIRELGERGPSKIPELKKAVDDLMMKDKLGSKNKVQIREFLLTTLKKAYEQVKDTGVGKIRKVYVGALLKNLEKGISLNA